MQQAYLVESQVQMKQFILCFWCSCDSTHCD